MRHSLFILICSLIAQLSRGQTPADTLIAKRTLDSLHREVADLKARNNFLYWRSRINDRDVRIDTVFFRANSALFSYFSGEGKLIMQETAELHSRKRWIPNLQRYYDDMGRIVYALHWIVIGGDDWDSKMEKEERMDYDSLGRMTLHVTYLSTLKKRTERTVFWYDGEGKQYQMTRIYKGYSLWD